MDSEQEVRYSLSEDGVKLLGDVVFLGGELLLADLQHQVGVGLPVGVSRSQAGGLQTRQGRAGSGRDKVQ